jgi:hypothetical protein
MGRSTTRGRPTGSRTTRVCGTASTTRIVHIVESRPATSRQDAHAYLLRRKSMEENALANSFRRKLAAAMVCLVVAPMALAGLALWIVGHSVGQGQWWHLVYLGTSAMAVMVTTSISLLKRAVLLSLPVGSLSWGIDGIKALTGQPDAGQRQKTGKGASTAGVAKLAAELPASGKSDGSDGEDQ